MYAVEIDGSYVEMTPREYELWKRDKEAYNRLKRHAEMEKRDIEKPTT